MRIWKKLCAWLLAVVMTACGVLELAPLEAYAAAASSTTTISNQYLQYTLNRATGGFSIDTLEGHPQKKYDNNLPLLYKESNEGMETSYVTLRIKEENGYNDYIFGQDYSWLLGPDQGKLTVSEPKEEADATILTAEWNILEFTVTQEVALSKETTTNGNTTGNVGISYSIQNNNEDAREAGLRVLLDTALSNQIDAPYILTDDSNYSAVEKSYSGEKMPTQFRGVDSLSSPTRMCYAILNGWEGKEADKVIVGHWANLANSKYEYTPDSSCDFTNRSNKYITADSAMALYWSPTAIAAGDKTTCQFLYGVGNFSSELTDKKVNINMTVGNVTLNEDGNGYADDGVFEVEATIDNTVSNAETLKSPSMTLSLEEGLTLVTNPGEGFETTNQIQLGDTLKPGKTVTRKFKVQAEKQPQITAKAVTISLNTISQINEAASRYVVLPNALGEAAKVKFAGATPDKIYTEGDRSFAVSGDFEALKALRGTTGWAFKLKSVLDGTAYTVEKKNIAFDDEYKNMNVIVQETMPVGIYRLVFEFESDSYIQAFGKELDSGLKLEVSADPALKDPSYGIISLVRYNGEENDFVFVPFRSEAEYNDFVKGDQGATIQDQAKSSRTVALEEYNYLDGDGSQEILATLRGKLQQIPQEDGSTYYIMSPADNSNVTINNCISCEGNVELYYDKNSGLGNKEYAAIIKGEGDIRVINSISFWKKEWSIEAPSGMHVTLEEGAKTPLEVSLGGAAQMIQSIGGMIVDLKYGILTSQVLEDGDNQGFGYGVSFGGSMSIPISVAKGKSQNTNNSSNSGSGNTGSNASGGNNTGGTTGENQEDDDDDDDDDINDGNLLSAEIENILYGEKSLKDYVNPEAKGAKADSGYIGTNVTVGVGLPENIMGKLVSNVAGAQAVVHVDTIEGVYEVSAGMKLAILSCEGTIGFKTVEVKGVERTLPDTLIFAITDGLRVPIAPPTLFMSGIGGGVSELADTIGGDYVKNLPPLTIHVQMALDLVEVLEAEMEAQINAFGMSLSGKITPSTSALKDVLEIEGGIAARWIDPFYLNAYGKVNVLEIIKGGASITIKSDYFRGYAYVAITIPDSIPLVGGVELARVEAAISSDYVGANVKIIGIGIGVIYYFADGKVNIGSQVDIGSIDDDPEELVGASADGELVTFVLEDGDVTYSREDTLAIEEESVTSNGEEQDYTMVVGTNLHKLNVRSVRATQKKSSNYVLRNKVKSADSGSSNVTTWHFNPKGQDALLIQVPFEYKGEMPSDINEILNASDITLKDPKGQSIALSKMDPEHPEQGNFMLQQIQTDLKETKNYLFISITDKDKLIAGDWILSIDDPESKVSITNAAVDAYGVDNVPTLTETTVESVDGNPMKAKISWTASGSKNYTGHVACYLNTDKEIVEKIQEDAKKKLDENPENAQMQDDTDENSDLGIQIYEESLASITSKDGIEVDLPKAISSGKYYLITTLSVDKGGATSMVSEVPITITNSNLPEAVESAVLTPAGDGKLQLDITDSTSDYNEYYVELQDEDGNSLVNGFYDKGDSIVFGPVIKAATVDDPTTQADESSPEERLEIGKSYRAVVKTCRKESPQADENGLIENNQDVRYMGDAIMTTEYTKLPEIQPPVLVSVQTEGMGNSSYDGKTYSNDKHIKAVYTFAEALKKLTVKVDGTVVETTTNDNKVWSFEKDVEDGTHTVDFEAVSTTGDTLKGGDEKGSLGFFGFITDTEIPMLSIDKRVQESADVAAKETSDSDEEQTGTSGTDVSADVRNDGKIGVSSQTVTTDEKGTYTILGHTEPDATLAYSGDGSIQIEKDGTFTITGMTQFGDEIFRQEKVSAWDKAGNKNEISVYIVNGNISYPSQIVLTNNGKEIKETDGVKMLAMKTGEQLDLTAVGYDQNGEVICFDTARLEWDTMYESNLISLDGGHVIAIGTGETAVRVVLPYSNIVQSNDNTIAAGPGDFVKITIKEGSTRSVAFYGGGGTGKTPDTIYGVAGSIVRLPNNPYTKEGTEFEGWSDGTKLYAEGAEYIIPSTSIRLIAKWKGEDLVRPGGGGGIVLTPTPTETPTETPIETPTPTLTPGQEIAEKTPQVKVSSVTSDAVRVTWKGVSGAQKYRVYYRIAGGRWKRAAEVLSATRSYTVKKLQSGKKYYFTIRAYADGVLSKYQTNVSKITLLKTPSVKVKTMGDGTVKVTWTKVSGAKKYYVYYKVPGGKWKRIAEKSRFSSSYTMKNLKKGKTYLFTVKAVGKVDNKTIYSDYKTNIKIKVK